MVTIEDVRLGQRMTKAQLESMGLVAPAPEVSAPPREETAASPLRCSDLPRRLAWPSYDLCTEGALARGKKRSSADFTFACIAINHFKRTPKETADKLMEVSPKAQENGYDYALGQAQRAAEKVAANPAARADREGERAACEVDIDYGSLYIWGMEVDFSPEQLQQLSQIAAHVGTDTEHLVKDAALRLVEENAKFRAAVREGIAQADRGELVEDEEVRLWLEERERS